MEKFIVKFVRFCEILLLHLVSYAAVLAVRGCRHVAYELSDRMEVLGRTFLREQELIHDDIMCIDFVCR